jgi:hypothetical protein
MYCLKTCISHVFRMYFPCIFIKNVFRMYFECILHVFRMYITCIIKLLLRMYFNSLFMYM